MKLRLFMFALAVAGFAIAQTLPAGASIRTSGGANPLAAYGYGSYVFYRCQYPPLANGQSVPNTGIYTSSPTSFQIVDAGLPDGGAGTFWERQIRAYMTSQPFENTIAAPSAVGVYWRGINAGEGGFTGVWRFGAEVLGTRSFQWAGMLRNSPTCLSGDGAGFAQWNTNVPVGVWMRCYGDGLPVVCSSVDGGGLLDNCNTLSEPFRCRDAYDGGYSGTAYEFILSNAGSGSTTYNYTVTELNSGATTSGSLTNTEQSFFYPSHGACRATFPSDDVNAFSSFSSICVGSNW